MKAFVLLLACLATSASLSTLPIEPTSPIKPTSPSITTYDPESTLTIDTSSFVPETTTLKSACPEPFEFIGGKCLLVDNFTKGTYQGMKQFCEMFDGRVVKIANADSLRAIADYIYNNKLTTISFWIGATDEAAEGTWKWEDETHVSMGTPFWANYGCSNLQAPDGETNENCAVLDMDLHFYFNDVKCDSDAGVICEVLW